MRTSLVALVVFVGATLTGLYYFLRSNADAWRDDYFERCRCGHWRGHHFGAGYCRVEAYDRTGMEPECPCGVYTEYIS